ncbi:MAG: hypothetical protein R3F61_37290 [Myxococcota bacterium]
MRAHASIWVLGLALSACKKPAPTDPVVDFTDFTAVHEDPLSTPGSVPVGPGEWSGGGLALFVPPGWSGSAGPEPLLLHIQNETTGVSVDLLGFTTPLGRPRSLPDDECGFVDNQRFRTVPALGLSQTATCTGDAGVRQVWWAELDGREVHVEAVYPPGRMIRGRQTITPMLEALHRVD